MINWNLQVTLPEQNPDIQTDENPPTRPNSQVQGLDSPVTLNTRPPGTRFLLYFDAQEFGCYDWSEQGTLLYVGPGSLEVWLDHEKGPSRVAHELKGYLIDDYRPFLNEHDYELAAGKIGLRDILESLDDLPQDEKEQVMAEVGNQAAKALLARWNYQIKNLQTAKDGDDKAAASATRARLEKIGNEARTMRIKLPTAPFEDEVFSLIGQANDKVAADSVGVEGESTATDTTMPRQTLVGKPKSASKKGKSDVDSARDAAVEKHRAEKGTSAASQTRPASKPKEAKNLRPCLDGCGTMVGGNFAMGHDAKLKSILQKVERGEMELTDVPEIVQELVFFKKGELIEEKDGNGDVKMSTQTYQLLKAPVKFPGRPEIILTKRDD